LNMKLIKKSLKIFLRFPVFELVWLIAKYSIYQRRNKSTARKKNLIAEVTKLFINRLKVSRADNSFANENETIGELLSEINLVNHYLVDIGAADGTRQSSTLKLLTEMKWSGSLFEFDSQSFSKLAFLYADRKDICLAKTKITPQNIGRLLAGLNVPLNFDFLNLDIDSYDLEVMRALISDNFRPGLISMEINEIFPPNIYFEVLYNPNHVWQEDHFFGCSVRAAFDFFTENDYVLMTIEFNNAFFVDKKRLKNQTKGKDIWIAYDQGYHKREERLTLFPWNKGIEFQESWNFDQVKSHFDAVMPFKQNLYKLEMRNCKTKPYDEIHE